MRKLILFVSLWAAPVAAQDVWVLGEIHDNPAHHIEQANLVAEIQPTAVVFEMLSPDQADIINRDVDPAEVGNAVGWADSGWPDYSIYQPIFEQLNGARVYGASLPREVVMSAAGQGAAAVFGPDAGDFGLAPLDAEKQAAFEEEIFLSHCSAMPRDVLGGIVEAQRLRDAHFARVALSALRETSGPVAVITGNGHARNDRAIPAIIASAAPEVDVVSYGILENADDSGLYDVTIVTGAFDRPDPCDAFN
ncbi:hypothetical protein BVC71_09870 [Marivivens niveibacter]|uniref:Haem-binding uptake Tiki superfamily ChaN domain-containing protein n=1 Tax=Marivivens niveibacter TaxID=1930667 RepID=A0A251WXB1_9RHOB|nr:ChaN family lipoprotein [Marivivens niveibacter]OUD09012.1 hypothetical protein BVC71_09870 [Marivivens niveibacter]